MRTLLFTSSLLCCALARRADVVARASTNSSNSAVVISPSQYFEGNDGPWSTFDLRVGENSQDIRVIVSTASPESFVVFSDYGCSSAVFPDGIPDDCAVSRGNLFNHNDSGTWVPIGDYQINGNGVGLEANLGYSTSASFGLDTLGIGLTGPILDNQTIAGLYYAEPFYLGMFGLNNQPVNFTALGNDTSSSFITTLKDQGQIPSLSWSYTAGAKYRLKQVYGQLIFSGYDTSRFTENSVSFTMADDYTRDLVVSLQSISYSGSTTSVLLSDSIDIFIDSTDPNLWLPDDVCDAFEQAFGLTIDDASGLYLVNDTHHVTLQNSNAQVSFRLSDVNSGGSAVTITLPYDAFDLQAESPLVNDTSYYFPLKRAANETQYTLGRTFLQEAYLSADYERGVFNVSACTWQEGAESTIVTIPPNDGGDDSGSSGSSSSQKSSSGLGGGAIAGIVIGSILGALLIGAIVIFCLRRQRKKSELVASGPEPDMAVITGPVHNLRAEPSTRTGKFYSPETLGTSTGAANSENIAESSRGSNGASQQELDAEETEIQPPTELDATDTPEGASVPDKSPTYHELGGTEIAKTDNDQTSTLGVLPTVSPTYNRREPDEASLDSPFVSTLGTMGWQGEEGDRSSDLISPVTPTHDHRFSRSPKSPTRDSD
ncbi:acid protease [Xylariaceae sp. FL1272]|nr:acid protease [Xylariaceae sp. FL1272]